MFKLKNIFCFVIVVIILLGVLTPLCSKGKKDMTYSFVPADTRNVIAINLKKFFQLFNYKDIYKLSFLNKNKAFKDLYTIIKNAGIDPKIDLDYLLLTNTVLINNIDFEKIFSKTVFIIKLSYNDKKLEKSIIKFLKKQKKNFTTSKLKNKKTFVFGTSMSNFSIVFHDKRTILIGNKNEVFQYIKTFNKEKKNIFSNKKFMSVFNIIKKRHILTFYLTPSFFLKDLFDQKDASFKMNLENIHNFEGSFDSEQSTITGRINIISNNKKANKLTENGLRKLLAMSAMANEKYINIAEKININVVERGIRIFFTFDIE